MSQKTDKAVRRKSKQLLNRNVSGIVGFYLDSICKEKLFFRIKFAWDIVFKINPYTKKVVKK